MVRKSTSVRFISGSLRLLELVLPAVAARLARRLFFTPGRRKATAQDQQVLGQARGFALRLGARTLHGYTWGSGRPVLLVHGWGGYSGQFAALIPALVERGYRVVSLDFPAHGNSEGGQTSVVEFRAALLELARREGSFKAIVGHSLGAMAAALALGAGLSAERVVLLAPMTSFTFAVNAFGRELGLSRQLKVRATARIVERFDDEDVELELVRQASQMRIAALVVHDEDDRRVPCQLGRELARTWPQARYVETRGLGHKRILSAPVVVRKIVDFVATTDEEPLVPGPLRGRSAGMPLDEGRPGPSFASGPETNSYRGIRPRALTYPH